MNNQNKLAQLEKILAELKEVIIAFSGGIDSTFLAQVAFNVLKEKAIAITLNTPQFPKHELTEAKALAKEIGIKHIIIETNESDYTWFEENPPDRCYICKKSAIERIQQYCKEIRPNYLGEVVRWHMVFYHYVDRINLLVSLGQR